MKLKVPHFWVVNIKILQKSAEQVPPQMKSDFLVQSLSYKDSKTFLKTPTE